MEQLIYANEVVESHKLYALSPSFLNSVSNKDYPGKDYFDPKIKCIDMDDYEQNIVRSEQSDCTVDAVIGIQSYINNQAINSRLLLVELRMGYQNVNNLEKEVMEKKVRHTKGLLGGERTINKLSLFVFNDNVASRARHIFNRLQQSGGEIRDCESLSVTDFNNLIRSKEDYPYIPINSEQDILNHIDITNKPFKEVIENIRFWCEQRRSYEHEYPPRERNHITIVLQKVWKKNIFSITNEDEEWEILLIEDDFPFLTE